MQNTIIGIASYRQHEPGFVFHWMAWLKTRILTHGRFRILLPVLLHQMQRL